MREAKVVIGANFGDEGKGLMTDYLVAKHGGDCLVVRFNGGAQAGHTVTTPDGKRHVFGHIGSGSFLGASTFLSRYFVVNPILFQRELQHLEKWGVNPAVLVDAGAPVTTPYDMLINQMVEKMRGTARHGSCGVGFGETIERNLDPLFALTVSDLLTPVKLQARLKAIRDSYLPQRLARLGLALTENLKEVVESDGTMYRFMEDCEAFADKVTIAEADVLTSRRQVIFEGAQGLLLDQDHHFFPHVTRSKTGVHNAAILAREAGIDKLDLFYMTRAYATRHGAGPFPYEIEGLPYPGIRDETNIPNAYQGTLRFGWLDLDLLADSISKDLHDAGSLAVTPYLGITCLDQIGNEAIFAQDGRLQAATITEFLQRAAETVETADIVVSKGPTRSDVSELNFALQKQWAVGSV